jgi:hypothetical protein
MPDLVYLLANVEIEYLPYQVKPFAGYTLWQGLLWGVSLKCS